METNKTIFDFIRSKKVAAPDDEYFNQLAEKIIAQSSKKVVPLYKKPFVKWMAAAAVILPLGIYFMFQNSSPAIETTNFSTLSKDEIHSYISNNLEEFNTDEIIEMVDTQTIDELRKETVTLTIQSEQSFFSTLTTDEIKSYFEMENIELEEFDENELFI